MEKLPDLKLLDRMRLNLDITTPQSQAWIATTAETTAVVAEMSRVARNQDTVRPPPLSLLTSISLTCEQNANDPAHHTTNAAMTDDALDHRLEAGAMLLHNATIAPTTDLDLKTRAPARPRAHQSQAV